MIQLQISRSQMEMELRGSDEVIVDELSTASIRMLSAMERYGGNPEAMQTGRFLPVQEFHMNKDGFYQQVLLSVRA